jgi:hypothetical protein
LKKMVMNLKFYEDVSPWCSDDAYGKPAEWTWLKAPVRGISFVWKTSSLEYAWWSWGASTVNTNYCRGNPVFMMYFLTQNGFISKRKPRIISKAVYLFRKDYGECSSFKEGITHS